jgi:N-glycosylase/DNA lyase
VRGNSLPWREIEENALWRELAACILGSRVSHEKTFTAVERLQSSNLFEPLHAVGNLSKYEARTIDILKEQRYPFPYARTHQLRRSLESIYLGVGSLKKILLQSKNAADARCNLVAKAHGIGPKQASLFLRNIGYSDDLAILDVHVLHYLTWIGLVSENPKVHSIKRYENIENVFRSHARQLGYSAAQLDLAVWVVVRVAKRNNA